MQHLRGRRLKVAYSLLQHGTVRLCLFIFALAERKNEKIEK
jgi:hypothetical protein